MKGWRANRVTPCPKERSEWLWRGPVVWPAPGALRGGHSPGKHRRKPGKCDNLSFLRVCLSQMDREPGSTDGYAPINKGRRPNPSRELCLDRQQ